MKTLFTSLVLIGLMVGSSSAHAADEQIIDTATQTENLYGEVSGYLKEYQSNKLDLAAQKGKPFDMAKKLELQKAIRDLQASLEIYDDARGDMKRADRKNLKKDNQIVTKEKEAELAAKKAELKAFEDAWKDQEKLTKDLQKKEAKLDKEFDKKMDGYRERSSKLMNYKVAEAKIKGDSSFVKQDKLTPIFSQRNSELKKFYSDTSNKDYVAGVLTPSKLPAVSIVPAVTTAPIQADLSKMQADLKKQMEKMNLPVANCNDDALAAMVKTTLAKDPQVLSQLFEVSTLKMAYAMQVAGTKKAALEDAIKTVGEKSLNKESTDALAKLYHEKGRDADLQKLKDMLQGKDLSYRNKSTRLNNFSASTLIQMFKKPQPTEITDFTEIDAAAVWAVEKIRVAQERSDEAELKSLGKTEASEFSLGQREGNMLNFSNRVYALVNPDVVQDKPAANVTKTAKVKKGARNLASIKSTIVPKDFKAEILANNKKIDAALEGAFTSLSAEQKKCLLAAEACTTADGLSSGQKQSIQKMIVDLAKTSHSKAKTGGDFEKEVTQARAVIDPEKVLIDSGEITLNFK